MDVDAKKISCLVTLVLVMLLLNGGTSSWAAPGFQIPGIDIGQYIKPNFPVINPSILPVILPVTDDAKDDRLPSLNNGYAFWYKGGDGIYMWDTSKDVSTAQKVVSDSGVRSLSSYGKKVAYWSHMDKIIDPGGGIPPIHFVIDTVNLWDGHTTKEVAFGIEPSLYGNKVAYAHYDGSDYEIVVSDGSAEAVTNNHFNDSSPSLYGDKVAWHAWDGHDYEIYYGNASHYYQLTSNGYNDKFPSFYDGKIAWQGWDGHDWEIYYYDGTHVIQVTNNKYNDLYPSLYDGKIAWQGWDGHDWEIYYYDSKKNTISRVTNNQVHDIQPSLYNGAILWRSKVGSDYDIMYCAFDIPQKPTVSTLPAQNITQTSGKIRGAVNPNGQATTYYFEWGTSTSYGHETAHRDAGSFVKTLNVDETIANLTPGTTYHYRLVAQNPSGTSHGSDRTFTTTSIAVALPTAATGSASGVTENTSVLSGTVNPQGAETRFRFEYGTDTSYGSVTPWFAGGNGTSDMAVNASITGLTPSTTYHFRIVARNSAGTVTGNDATFTTTSIAVALPTATTGSASSVTETTAVLSGTVNPQGAETRYRFEYGPDTSYGSATPWFAGGNGTSDMAVNASIIGLDPSTTYHFRIVAQNSAGSVKGNDATFTTSAQANPMTDTRERFTGWWYNSTQQGTGLAVAIQDNNKVFLAWFVYDAQGRTTWYASGGSMANANTYVGELRKWTGWAWGTEPYSMPMSEVAGSVTLVFNKGSNDSISFTATVGGTVVTNNYTAFMKDFAPGNKDSRNFTGWWYDPNYNGMGFYLDAHGGKMAIVWYNYRDDHSPRWWTSTGAFADGSATYSGALDGWMNGQCVGCTFTAPPQRIPGQGGTVTINFTDADHATMTVGSTTVHLQRFLIP